MKVFLSWSGPRSKAVAQAFSEWLPQVIQSIEPWISSDIEKGARWSEEIASQLENTSIGIICLTHDNLTAPWILFESGALSKTKAAYVCTFLLDIKPTTVEPPLGQFQHTRFDKADVRLLLQTINKAVAKSGNRPLSDGQLENAFDVWWPKLEEELNAIPSAGANKAEVRRADRDLLEEILEAVRGLQRPATTRLRQEPSAGPTHRYEISVADATEWDTQSRESLMVMLAAALDNFAQASHTPHGPLKISVMTRGPALKPLEAAVAEFAPSGTKVRRVFFRRHPPAPAKPADLDP